MSETSFENLLNSLAGVLEDAGFVVTPDQIVRAQAVLMRLGPDRSRSGLVSLLCPIFCTSADQQEQFASLFIRAMDLSDASGSTLEYSNPHVLGRAKRPAPRDTADEDRRMRQARAFARAELPRQLRKLGGIALVFVLFVVLVAIGVTRFQPEPERPVAGPSTVAGTPLRKQDAPKTLPPIDGHSTLDIRIDQSGHDTIKQSLIAKSPIGGAAVILLAGVLTLSLGLFLRKRRSVVPPPRESVSPSVPKELRYGRKTAVAAANQLLIPGEDQVGRSVDVDATVLDHMRVGYWRGLRRSRPHHPEYIAITKNPATNDARALVSDALIRDLEHLGVSIETFYYDGNPQNCVSRNGRRRVTLEDLARERGDNRLLFFSDGSDVVQAPSWAGTMRSWRWRLAFGTGRNLVSLPGRAWPLGRLPASMRGLASLGLTDSVPKVEPQPDLTTGSAKEQAIRLERWLGPNAFQWLAACAIYSEFNGAILLHLGEMPELGELTEEDLERVLDLPYVSEGRIPEDLRVELIERLHSKVAAAARRHVVKLMKAHEATAGSESSESFRVELAAQKWLASRTSADREEFASAVRRSKGSPIDKGSTLFAFTEEAIPFWTLRRFRQTLSVGAFSCCALLALLPLLPLFAGVGKAKGFGTKPLGTDFGEWICFTKIEQTINWDLPPGTVVKKLQVVGYDQTAAGEGFQLVSRSDPKMVAGPVESSEGDQAADASLVFAPLHAKEYTGLLDIETNRGHVAFHLRGTGVYGNDGCVDEGHGQFGLESDFNGGGCNQITEKKGVITTLLAPARPTGPSDSHSALVLGPWRQGDFDLTCGVRTIAQLRDPAPFHWEVGWLIWNFVDLKHFYYLALKDNGWELGRKDNLTGAGQRFLGTKDTPVFPPGRRYFVHITRRGDSLTVDVDGKRLTSIVDSDHPVTSGRIGFYSEAAASKFDSFEIH